MKHRPDEKWLDLDYGKAFDKWISSQSRRYGLNARRSFMRFLEFLKTQGLELNSDSLLARHRENRRSTDQDRRFEIDDLVPQWHKWLMEKYELSYNSALTRVVHVQGFFLYFRDPLQLKRGQLVVEEVPERYHIFSHEELCRMFDLADLGEKAFLCLGVNLGLRVDDFINLKRSPRIEASKRQNFPLEFQLKTQKEKVLAVCHVTEECWQILCDWWAISSESQYVFPAFDGNSPISVDKVEDVLKRLWTRAYPQSEEDVKWHGLRKYLLSSLGNVGVNHVHTLRMIGKKVEASIATYLVSMDLRKDFEAVEPLVTLGVGRSSSIGDVEFLREENRSLKERIQSLEISKKDYATRFASLYIHLNLQEEAKGLDLGTSEKAAAEMP
ncbi:tyrosine-type recombinase/integrase [Candidatus Bathyarchaeota archaeon]|nr:tyrosine-type recombinase/integrase [Candidatus Bathyarchaeota archaeon]